MIHHDPLRQLLQSADRVPAARPDDPGALAAAIIQRHGRQQRRVRAGAAACVTIATAVASSALLWHTPRSPRPHVLATTSETTSTPVELARLDEQANVHARTAQLLLVGEQRRASQRRAAQTSAAGNIDQEIRRQRGAAALTLVRSGDRLRAASPDDAAVQYRRAIELFPETPAAAVAARRLGRPPI